jgi:hypothetical protein
MTARLEPAPLRILASISMPTFTIGTRDHAHKISQAGFNHSLLPKSTQLPSVARWPTPFITAVFALVHLQGA